MSAPTLGLALGSGSARGWAHIGVIRALEARGVAPQVVCGTSVGALVGAAWVSGHLDALEAWVREMDWWDVLRFMDVKLGGGFISGEALMAAIGAQLDDVAIETLPHPFAAVATDLFSGEEMWLREGSLLEAVRASIALPGLFTPVARDERWLVDGGVVNPVPVSTARALGADTVIAVNLNGDLVGRHRHQPQPPEHVSRAERAIKRDFTEQLLARVNHGLRERLMAGFRPGSGGEGAPGLFEVLASAINVMQDRITQQRLAQDAPAAVLTPRLANLGLLEFDRAAEAIDEGYACVERQWPALEATLATTTEKG